MEVKAFFHEDSSTLTYVVWDRQTNDAVVIDPVLDFDPLAWSVGTHSAREVLEFVDANDLEVHWILDTHAHADHLSGMDVFKRSLGTSTAISTRIRTVQSFFKSAFNLPAHFPIDGSQFDRLVEDGEILEAGSLRVRAIHTPGHTPACMTCHIGEALFTGDTLFMPDFGTGRCDFPAGSVSDLYHSVMDKLYTLPPETRVFVGHDYQPGGRELQYQTTIGESRNHNKQLRHDTTEDEFARFRSQRDAQLKPPRLILQSLQVNINAGRLPEPEVGDRRFFKMPLNFL